MSDDIREALARLLREHRPPLPDDGYPADEYDCCADAILERFLVVPRDQVTTEYGVSNSGVVGLTREEALEEAARCRAHGYHQDFVAIQRLDVLSIHLPWTVIPSPEDGDTQ